MRYASPLTGSLGWILLACAAPASPPTVVSSTATSAPIAAAPDAPPRASISASVPQPVPPSPPSAPSSSASDSCGTPPAEATFAVVFLDKASIADEIVLLDHEALCGSDPRCPNAHVTYTSSRLATTSGTA